MKTKLYKKFVNSVCKDLGISRKQLFSRDFNDFVLPCYKFNLKTYKIEKDCGRLIVLSIKHPLSQIWDAVDMHTRWFIKHWRNSHWKPYVQMRLDLGEKLNDILTSILRNEAK